MRKETETDREIRIEKVLVAVNCSSEDDRLLATASGLARLAGARIRLLHLNDLGPDAALSAAECECLLHRKVTEATRTLRHTTAELRDKGFEVEILTHDGIPAEEILKAAHDVDMIVVGRHEKRRWQLFRRRTLEAVLEGASCPVVVVPLKRVDQIQFAKKQGFNKASSL